MRAFPVRLPSGVRYWTVLDEELQVVPVADSFLRHVRFGRDGAESTTKAYAGAVALFLRWCARTGRSWQGGVEQFGLFVVWLGHAGPAISGIDGLSGGSVLNGPGAAKNAKLGCVYDGECKLGGHVHARYIQNGRIVKTIHFAWRRLG
jgi:hypothetical protein